MPKHIVRLLLLVGLAIVAFVGVRSIMVDESFAMFGHYRGASVQEVAFPAPVIKTPAYCQLCHFDRHAEWRAAGHRTVMCETCHGPAVDHPAKGRLPIPEHSVSLCISCHEHMPARRRGFPQVVLSLHLAGLGRPMQCIACHNPHTLEIIKPSENEQLGDQAVSSKTPAAAVEPVGGSETPARLGTAAGDPDRIGPAPQTSEAKGF